MDLTVACFWWDDPRGKCRGIYEYTAEHVRTLRSMVARHMSTAHRFVCVTDRPDALPDVETAALDGSRHVPGTRFAKLMLWRADIGEILGRRILYLDLDCVVTGSLDPLIDRGEDVVLWRNPNFGAPRRARYNTSIMLLRAGARPALHADFDRRTHPEQLRRRWGGTDQAWISERCSPDEAHWSADDGVYGAGRLRDIVPGVGTALPANARIVFFPGAREPSMPAIQARHSWIREHRW